jgi:hypothetical protein
MSAPTPNGSMPVLNHDQIARLVRQIGPTEGGPPGGDPEYWLKVERLILAAGQPGKKTGENCAGQPHLGLSGARRVAGVV